MGAMVAAAEEEEGYATEHLLFQEVEAAAVEEGQEEALVAIYNIPAERCGARQTTRHE